jgi:plastocyanin
MRNLLTPTLLAIFINGHALSAPATGTVSGRIQLPSRAESRIAVEKYLGTISGKVAPPPPTLAGVWIESPGITAPASPRPVVIDQLGYQFTHSLIVVPRGTVISFPNQDADYHNVFSLSPAARFDLGRFKKDDPEVPQYTFETSGFIRLRCEIHEHMRANVLVVDSPHFATTTGDFTLKNVPTGSHTLRIQLDEKTQWHAFITVKLGANSITAFSPGKPPSRTNY